MTGTPARCGISREEPKLIAGKSGAAGNKYKERSAQCCLNLYMANGSKCEMKNMK